MPKKIDKKADSGMPHLRDLNTTELWQMAARIGIQGASPATSRDVLLEALLNLDHVPMADPTARDRERFSNFLLDNLNIVRMQMPKAHCPNCHLTHGDELLSKVDGKPLESYCSDMEFVACWLENKHRVG